MTSMKDPLVPSDMVPAQPLPLTIVMENFSGLPESVAEPTTRKLTAALVLSHACVAISSALRPARGSLLAAGDAPADAALDELVLGEPAADELELSEPQAARLPASTVVSAAAQAAGQI
jgi:hypothetical protein